MTLTAENVLSALGLLGLGGLLSSYLTILWQRHSSVQTKKLEFKEARYKCTVILMYSCLDFEKNKDKLKLVRPELNTLEETLDEVDTEWHNMFLYGSDDVLKAMQSFLNTPNQETYYKAVLAMRKDLWGGNVSFKYEDITR